MPDLTPIQPIAAIIGAIITATVASLVTYFVVVKRKKLTFVISKTEDLTSGLRQHYGKAVLSIEGVEVKKLNRSSILVRNSGNTAIAPVEFDVFVPGAEGFYGAEVKTDDVILRGQVSAQGKIRRDKGSQEPLMKVALPFLNPKEAFELSFFFDGEPAEGDIACRMEDVTAKIRRAESLMELASKVSLDVSFLGLGIRLR